MCLPSSAQDMYCASVANIKLAKERWGRSRGCEQHWYPALAGADGSAPFQVVRSVFLRDVEDASFTREDLRQLLKQNSAGARVHVEEFAAGAAESRRLGGLHLLASKTGGSYRARQSPVTLPNVFISRIPGASCTSNRQRSKRFAVQP